MTYRARSTWDHLNARIVASAILLLLTLFLFGPGKDLLGATGKNEVTVSSGKIKADLVDSNEASLVGDVLEFINIDDTNEPFLFSPGKGVFTEGFQVKNTGNLPIEYRIFVSIDFESEQERFLEAFDFYITTEPYERARQSRLTAFEGRLEPGQSSDVFHLVVKMRKSAKNEFQGKTYDGIGITVYAVEGAVLEAQGVLEP